MGRRIRIQKGGRPTRKIRVAEFSFYVDQLRSEQCYCGRPKRYGYPFCYGCYTALPQGLMERVAVRLPEGFDLAFEEAVKELEYQGRIEK